jgi:aspartate/glutamate racemase
MIPVKNTPLFYFNPMHKPCVILTGKNAGVWYIQTLNALVNTYPSFEYETIQVNFEPINALLPYKMKDAAKLLEPSFKEMERRQKPYILANITLHEAVMYFSFPTKYFISIDAILKKEVLGIEGALSILGTKYTMNHHYIAGLLPHVEIVSLPENIQEKIDVLRQVYFKTSHKKMSKEVFHLLNQHESTRYIIACTELAMALTDAKIALKTIHLPELQCRYLCKQ